MRYAQNKLGKKPNDKKYQKAYKVDDQQGDIYQKQSLGHDIKINELLMTFGYWIESNRGSWLRFASKNFKSQYFTLRID
ncbi:MAG: hypothetical protein EA409_05365 [Saprospirales bacterium]|nr:MAG: hypothetical protein EA409_05365 [Saprospirales bacterium]